MANNEFQRPGAPHGAPVFFMFNAFFIVGPTAVGKTELAVGVAERFGAEIISADAYQIYQGFDLLTAKPTPAQLGRVPHHLVGRLNPSDAYNVALYLQDTRACLEEITRRGHPAVVVGGNGLYVKALTHGLSPLPPAQTELRVELEKLSSAELLVRLAAFDPVSAATIDAQNKRRLIRALEVCLMTGKPFSEFRSDWQNPSPDYVGVSLFRERVDLAERIAQRVDRMFAQGVVEEGRSAQTTDLSPTARQIMGLAEITAYLEDRLDLDECCERIKIATRQYAKRQGTWFKREVGFEPVNLSEIPDFGEQLNQVSSRFRSWRATMMNTPAYSQHKDAGLVDTPTIN